MLGRIICDFLIFRVLPTMLSTSAVLAGCRQNLASVGGYLCVALCLWSGMALAAPAKDAGGPRSLRVLVDDNYPPYAFRDANGQLNGYLVDVWKLWEQKTGVRAELLGSHWNLALQRMAMGQGEVIETIFRTAERTHSLDFSAPYASVPVSIYVHTGIGGIVDVNTLKGFLVGVKAGDACAGRLTDAGLSSLQTYDSYENLIKAAMADNIRIFCLDEPPANYLLYRENAERDFNRAFVLYSGELHRAVRKGDQATLDLVERGFAAISADETRALHEKWMGRRLDFEPFGRYLGYALAVTLALGAMLALWGFLLRRTVRQRTAELEDERIRLRTLVRTIPDMIWLKNTEGVYLGCNLAAERFFAEKEAEIVGKRDSELFAPELADLFRDNDRKVIAAGTPIYVEEWLQFPDEPGRRLFETIKTPLTDASGKLVGVLGVARDMTERKRAEEGLRLSEQKFAAAFRSSPDAIVISTAGDGRIIDVNDAFVRLSGFERSAIIGCSGGELQLWVDPALRDRCFERLRNEGRLENVEALFRVSNRQTRAGQIYAELIDIDGAPHALWVIRDITERKEAEAALHQANQRLHALSIRLLQVQEQERRNIARELHDEIGQSLTALKITLQSLGIRPETAALQKQINMAIGITDNALKQVRQLSLDLRPAQLDDLGLSAAIRWNLERQCQLAGLTPRFTAEDLPERIPEAVAIACYRISQEAITNAIKHAKGNAIAVNLVFAQDRLQLEVSDDGQGLTREPAPGAGGMGMVSMRERAALVGGQIEIEGGAGRGCTVRAFFDLLAGQR